MRAAPEEPDVRHVPLRQATEEAYCRCALRARRNEFWWYFNGLAPYRGYSRPFPDRRGHWWYCVKPGLAWPVNFFEVNGTAAAALPRFALLGAQWPVADPAAANSHMVMNVITDLSTYGLEAVDQDKRRAVRKGCRNLTIAAADAADAALAGEACEVWNDHVERTGWNTKMGRKQFVATWAELADWPGTTVLAATDPAEPGRLCAWLIVRFIDSAVYVDTIASHTRRRQSRPNDALLFTCLVSAKRQAARWAYYSLAGSVASLERFKQSLGFRPRRFPAALRLRWPLGPILRRLSPGNYRRLLGEVPLVAAAASPGAEPSAV